MNWEFLHFNPESGEWRLISGQVVVTGDLFGHWEAHVTPDDRPYPAVEGAWKDITYSSTPETEHDSNGPIYDAADFAARALWRIFNGD